MRTLSRFLPLIVLALTSVSIVSVASAQQLNDLANLKILKAKARLLQENKKAITDKVGNRAGIGDDLVGEVDCGSIAIGNQAAPTGLSQDISIIITGDIINTDNRCINTNTSSNRR